MWAVKRTDVHASVAEESENGGRTREVPGGEGRQQVLARGDRVSTSWDPTWLLDPQWVHTAGTHLA